MDPAFYFLGEVSTLDSLYHQALKAATAQQPGFIIFAHDFSYQPELLRLRYEYEEKNGRLVFISDMEACAGRFLDSEKTDWRGLSFKPDLHGYSSYEIACIQGKVRIQKIDGKKLSELDSLEDLDDRPSHFLNSLNPEKTSHINHIYRFWKEHGFGEDEDFDVEKELPLSIIQKTLQGLLNDFATRLHLENSFNVFLTNEHLQGLELFNDLISTTWNVNWKKELIYSMSEDLFRQGAPHFLQWRLQVRNESEITFRIFADEHRKKLLGELQPLTSTYWQECEKTISVCLSPQVLKRPLFLGFQDKLVPSFYTWEDYLPDTQPDFTYGKHSYKVVKLSLRLDHYAHVLVATEGLESGKKYGLLCKPALNG